MKAKSIHLTYPAFYSCSVGKQFSSNADIEVEGLGVVKIEDCLSRETIEAVEKEVVEALRIKFGQKVKVEAKPVAAEVAAVLEVKNAEHENAKKVKADDTKGALAEGAKKYSCSCGNVFSSTLGKYGCANCEGEGKATLI